MKDLNVHLGEWLKQRARYAADLSPLHVQQYFLDILPDELRLEIQRRPREYDSIENMLTFVQMRLARANDHRLAGVHEARRQEVLGGKNETFAAALSDKESEATIRQLKLMYIPARSQRSRLPGAAMVARPGTLTRLIYGSRNGCETKTLPSTKFLGPRNQPTYVRSSSTGLCSTRCWVSFASTRKPGVPRAPPRLPQCATA